MFKAIPIFLLTLLFPFVSARAQLRHVHRLDILGANVFLLETDSALFMIDAGYPKQEARILKKIRNIGKPLKLIIITHGHFDHYGSAPAIKRATGAALCVHAYDSSALCDAKTPIDSVNAAGWIGKAVLPLVNAVFGTKKTCPDFAVHDGDSLNQWGLAARIVHTPGHTRGSVCVIVQDSLAFVGDLLTPFPKPQKQCYYANSWGQIDQSVKKLNGYKFTTAYIGHGRKTVTKEYVTALVKGK